MIERVGKYKIDHCETIRDMQGIAYDHMVIYEVGGKEETKKRSYYIRQGEWCVPLELNTEKDVELLMMEPDGCKLKNVIDGILIPFESWICLISQRFCDPLSSDDIEKLRGQFTKYTFNGQWCLRDRDLFLLTIAEVKQILDDAKLPWKDNVAIRYIR